MTGRASDL